jgi:hypothetical protein
MPPAPTTEPRSTEPVYVPHTKLAVVYFRESVTFGGEMQSASVPFKLKDGTSQRGSNSVDEIKLAWLTVDGRVIDDHAQGDVPHGLVLRSKVHDQHNAKRIVRQVFVPWSNVKSIGYSE